MPTTETNVALRDLTGDYHLDPAHSRAGFVARYAMVTKVRGQFRDFDSTIHVDADDPTRSTAEVRVRMASLDTSQEQRDAHLRSADFFDVENYPEMVFRSTGIEKVGDDTYRVDGELTIKDVTHPISVELEYTGTAKDPFGNLRVGFEGRADISRRDWGLTWNAALESGGLLVSDKIRLELDLSAVKVVPAA